VFEALGMSSGDGTGTNSGSTVPQDVNWV